MFEALDILKQYGWKGLILALLVVVIYKFLIESISILTNKIKSRMLSNKRQRLSMHAFFNSINYILNVELHSLVFFSDKPVRQALTKDLIVCSLSTMQETANKIISVDQSEWSSVEWAFQMRTALNDMNREFLNKCIKQGIPEIVYVKYLEWYFERLNHMRILIDQISASDLSPTPESKTSTLLLLLNLFITTMMGDCESAMNELNGEITGITYRGGIVEPLADH